MKESWEIKKLGEVASFVGGGTPSKSIARYYEGNIKWATVRDMTCFQLSNTELCISQEAVDKSATNILPKGTIIISTHVGIGKICELMQDTAINQDLKGVILSACIDKYFFSYWYKEQTPLILSNATGATVKGVTLKFVNNMLIPVPPLSEQQRIVSELDCISGIIEKKKQQLKELDNLAQSIFYDMFGDPITNEKGWEVKKLGEVADIIGGSTPKTNIEENWIGNNNWISPAEIKDEKYIGRTEKSISDKAASRLTLLPVGTVLFSSRAPIGKLAITTIPMYCNQGFKNIVCGNKLNNEYVYMYMQLNVERLQALGVGATFKEVSKSIVSSFPIPLPPLSLQQSFAAKITAIEKQKSLIKQSIAEAETLLASRMDYYFN